MCSTDLDLDNDGILDAGEPQTVTDVQGEYAFLNLEPGDYVVAMDNAYGDGHLLVITERGFGHPHSRGMGGVLTGPLLLVGEDHLQRAQVIGRVATPETALHTRQGLQFKRDVLHNVPKGGALLN